MSAPPTASSNFRSVSLRVTIVLLVLLAVVAFFAIRWRRDGDVTIGVEGQRIIEIAGPQLIAAPFTPGDALSVRIASAERTKDGFRCDIRYMAIGPGEHNIGESLVGIDGKAPAARPEFNVSVAALIPEKYSGQLFATSNSKIDLHTTYTLLMSLAWTLWAVLLLPLIFYGRDWRRRTVVARPEPSITERLRALLKQAASTNLTPARQADVEQLLPAFWSRRLNLSEERLSETIEQLRQHPQAGPQWSSVEQWFHARATPAGTAAARKLLADLESLN